MKELSDTKDRIMIDLGAPWNLPNHGFTFFTNHAHVLLLISNNEEVRMRELASAVGITERAIQRIVDDLAQAGYVSIVKEGRRNRYTTHAERFLRHPVESHRSVGDLVKFIYGAKEGREQSTDLFDTSWNQSTRLTAVNNDEDLRMLPTGISHGTELRAGEEQKTRDIGPEKQPDRNRERSIEGRQIQPGQQRNK
jgi:DNA-binding transcriptional ArsR family regulator